MNEMDEVQKNKRITFRSSRPNPLFQKWLEELYDEAKEKESKLQYMLQEALSSLSKYPLPLNSGMECGILKGFGKKLCLFLDKRLEAYNSSQNDNTNSCSDESIHQDNVVQESVVPIVPPNSIPSNNINKVKSPKRRKAFKPSHRSGGYAILIALLNHAKENSLSTTLNKEQLIEKAQPHSEESFTRPKPESYYTAWSNMTRLLSKGLVTKSKSRKPEYSLTQEGYDLATNLLNEYSLIPSVNDLIFNDANVVTNTNATNADQDIPVNDNVTDNNENDIIEMPQGSFDVILLIDKMETSGCSKKNDPTVAQFKKYPDLKHEYRHLKVGDFTWIARSRQNPELELVLPFIVERKRMDDLGSSIKDGRFHEQKFRLKKCGIKNVLYLVEHYGGNKHVGLPLPSLMQALSNTRVQDGFKIHMTDSLTNSARFLAMMTKRLTIEYKNRTLHGRNGENEGIVLMTFSYFNKSSAKSKTLTVTETFNKILLQLRGMSVEKALAITKVYSTPRSLIEKYKRCSQKEGETLLTYLKYGDLARNVGPTVSKTVYQLFSNTELL